MDNDISVLMFLRFACNFSFGIYHVNFFVFIKIRKEKLLQREENYIKLIVRKLQMPLNINALFSHLRISYRQITSIKIKNNFNNFRFISFFFNFQIKIFIIIANIVLRQVVVKIKNIVFDMLSYTWVNLVWHCH